MRPWKKSSKGTKNRRPEDAFQAQVIQFAKLCGWMVYHTYDSRRSVAGFPDLVLVRGTEVLFVELKAPKGRTTLEQKNWLEALSRVESVQTYLWKPEDWPAIEAALNCRVRPLEIAANRQRRVRPTSAPTKPSSS